MVPNVRRVLARNYTRIYLDLEVSYSPPSSHHEHGLYSKRSILLSVYFELLLDPTPRLVIILLTTPLCYSGTMLAPSFPPIQGQAWPPAKKHPRWKGMIQPLHAELLDLNCHQSYAGCMMNGWWHIGPHPTKGNVRIYQLWAWVLLWHGVGFDTKSIYSLSRDWQANLFILS